MNSEIKKCQNCHNDFRIDPDDFTFYEKIKVPPPTFCPECRFQRRTMFRNERVLYRRACDLCGKSIVSIFYPENWQKIFCPECWWSDRWDPFEFGRGYDPKRPFFEQIKELYRTVPLQSLVVDYPTLVNSEYVNHTGSSKNCYFVFDTDFSENTYYGTTLVRVKDSLDLNIIVDSQLCYWDINCIKCYNVHFSEDCLDCYNVYFSKNLSGCRDCFSCINLKNKNFYFFNQPCTREEYKENVSEFKLNSFNDLQRARAKAVEFWLTQPYKYMHGRHNVNAYGDYVYNSKNVSDVYQVDSLEDSKFCCRMITVAPSRDCYDYFEWGRNAQRIYDCITVGQDASDIRFCFAVFDGVARVEYSLWITTSSDIFGCVGLRKKQYCILNRQYDVREYRELRERIIRDMNERPYTDSAGRIWRYGEFFPYDMSPFGYNETTAAQYISLTKEEAVKNHWQWRDEIHSEYRITIQSEDLPNDLEAVPDTIVNEVLECGNCKKAYRIVPTELKLLRKFGFALPRQCPECRHKERFVRISPPKLWDRTCAKCGTHIKTSYAPEGPEIIYCERCYNAEVI